MKNEAEIQKIKDLLNSSDINNHKLAYILAKSQLGMNDKEICSLVLMNGFNNSEFTTVTYKKVFNGLIKYQITCQMGKALVMFSLQIDNTLYNHFCMNKTKLGKRIKYVNEWFSKLDK